MTAHPVLSGVVALITANTQSVSSDALNLIIASFMCLSLHPPTLTQIMAYALLSRWGPDGFLAHCAEIAAFYHARRDVFERVARKHLTGLVEWTTPVAGMFLYIKVPPIPSSRESF
jgi:tryptophan aminotransferase